MVKRGISILLTIAMLITMLPAVVFAADADTTNVIEEFEQYLVNSKVLADDGYAGIPVHINTYVNGTTDSNSQVIVYIMNHAMERVGTESDNDIIRDFLNDTEYKNIVVTVDFLNNEKAISPLIDYSVAAIMADIRDSSAYLNGNKYGQYLIHPVPSGCRIERDVWYYSLVENAAKGTKEAIVDAWNSDIFKNTHSSKIPVCEGNGNAGGWFEATDISQLVKKNGEPIDTDLRMDIVYPSNPKEAPPVWMWASASETRSKSTLGTPYRIGFGLRGYAVAIYDHEYIPMSRNDHYGYYGAPYGVASTNGVKTHTAAARCVRYYADEFGYDKNRLSVGGHSKSSYSALLGRDNPELLEELSDYTKYGYTKGENYGEQPFLTYKNSDEKIPSNVQVVYTSMGDGAKLYDRLLCDSSVPAVIACGKNDQYGAWDYWPALQEAYMKWDIPHLAVGMTDMGHSLPQNVDPDLNYDRYDAVIDFFDYYLQPQNGSAPTVAYTYPVDGDNTFDGVSELIVKLNAPVDRNEFESKAQVINTETNEAIDGVWKACAGNTQYHFVSDEYLNRNTYKIVIPDTIAAENGDTLEATVETEFTVDSGDQVYSSKDAYVISGSETNTGSENTVEISKDNKIGYFEFDISSSEGKKEAGELQLSVANDASQKLTIYGIEDASWTENTITSSNAPSLDDATLITSVNVNGAGIYKIDVSDFVKTLTGDKVTFIVTAEKPSGQKGLVQPFDNLSSLVNTSVSDNNPVSDTAHYKVGGATLGVALSAAQDHTTGNGKSVYVKRDQIYNRIKFFNTFGSAELTAADIGDTYRISFWVKPVSDAMVQAGLMNSYVPAETDHPQYAYEKYDQNFLGTTESQSAKAGEWTEVSFKYTITQDNIDGRIQMLTVQTSEGACDLYIDDIDVELLATDVSITSKEGRNLAESQFKPKLVLTSKAPGKVWNQPMVNFNSSSDVTINSTTSWYGPSWYAASDHIAYMNEGYAKIFGTKAGFASGVRAGFTTVSNQITEDNELYMVCKIKMHPAAVCTRYRLVLRNSSGGLGSPIVFTVDSSADGTFTGNVGNTEKSDGKTPFGVTIPDYYGDGWVDCVAVIDLNNTDANNPVTVYLNGVKKTGSLYSTIADASRTGALIGLNLQNEDAAAGQTFIDDSAVYTIDKANLTSLEVSLAGTTFTTTNEVMLAELTNASDSTLSVIKANGQYLPIDAIKAERGGLAFTIDEEALSYGDNEIDLSEVKDIFGQNIKGENTFTITKDMDSVIVTSTSIGASYDDGRGTDTKTTRFFAALDSLDYAEAGFEVEATVNGETYTWKLSFEEVYKQVIANNIMYVPEENKFILTGAIGDIPATIMDVVQFNVQMYTTDFEGVTVKSNAVVIK